MSFLNVVNNYGMGEYTAKIGSIFQAGDLVTVQRGTKYFDLTYHGRGFLKTINHKSYTGFDTLSINDLSFLYWKIYGLKYAANENVEFGISSDTDALAHLSNEINVIYEGNGGTYKEGYDSDLTSKTILLSNEVYYDVINDNVEELRETIVYELCSNFFSYPHFRFDGWKNDNVVLSEHSIAYFDDNTTYVAQWVRQYYLKLLTPKNGSSRQITPVTLLTTYDTNTEFNFIAYPNDHHALSCWDVNEYDDNGNPVARYQQETIYSSNLKFFLRNNTTIEAIFRKLIHKLKLAIEPAESGKIEYSYTNDNTTKNDEIYSKNEYELEYGSRITLSLVPNEAYKLLHWKGDCDPGSLVSRFLNFQLTGDTDVTAVLGKKALYSVVGGARPSYAGYVVNGSDTKMHAGGTYYEDDVAELIAYPNDGFVFIGWYDVNGNKVLMKGSTPDPSKKEKVYDDVVINGTSLKMTKIVYDTTFVAVFNTYLITKDNNPILNNEHDNVDYSGSDLTAEISF